MPGTTSTRAAAVAAAAAGDGYDLAADFDIDPHPVNGAKDGTWNPGVLVARSTPGGRAFVAAEIDALHAASSSAGLRARGLSSAAMVSDQSEMCRMLRRLLCLDAASSPTGLDHARHAADVLHVP